MLRRASVACYALVFWRLEKRGQKGKFFRHQKFALLLKLSTNQKSIRQHLAISEWQVRTCVRNPAKREKEQKLKDT
jgi:hypothetical protein